MRSLLAVALGAIVLSLSAAAPSAAEDFSTELMNATVKISHEKATATAFLLSRPAPDDPKKSQFVLVSAAHVFEPMTGDSATLFFRRQDGDGVYRKVSSRLVIRKQGKPLWTKHPAVDVAVMPVEPPNDCKVPKISLDLLATDEALKKGAIHPGDTVRLLGYPHRFEANDAGFAVLRSGSVAGYPLTPTKHYKTFLSSINAFEGDSGGPVYLADSQRVTGDKKEPSECRLILGILVGQHFIDEDAKLIYEQVKIRHRMGLAIVVQAAFIKETIERLPRMP